ncbi:MAG TPA: hypothetical protein VLE91_04410 [Candidatus Saccharimonadales bacterium]|nr:hypothetical protein [Candidatus Saccharimonadales bacterium]
MAVDRRDYIQYQPAPTREHHPDHGPLPEIERVTLSTLAGAVRSIAKAYVYQTYTHPYPPNVSDDQIEKANTTNPDIFSEYTVVRRDPEGQLTAIPYHEAFGPQLNEVSEQLKDAAYYTRDPILKRYLIARARNLLDGNYEESEAIWLGSPMTKIMAVIGPYDRYKDRRHNKKYFMSGHVGTLDEAMTNEHQPFVDRVVDTYISGDFKEEPILVRPNVRIRYDITEVDGGLTAAMELTGNSYPCQLTWREKYGTEIVILEPPFFDKFHRIREPLIRDVVDVEHRGRQSAYELRKGYAYRYDGHETMHALIRRPQDEERFQGEYTFMNEMSATVIGHAVLGRMGLNTKQLEAIFASELAIAADEYEDFQYRNKKDRKVYLDGEAVLLNSLLEAEAISINELGEFTWNDIREVYGVTIDNLAHSLEVVLARGDAFDARLLKRNLGDFSVFEKLRHFKRMQKSPTAENAPSPVSFSPPPDQYLH